MDILNCLFNVIFIDILLIGSFCQIAVEMSTKKFTIKSATIEEALELTNYGKYTIALNLACGLSLFAGNCEIYSIGYILPAAECDLNLNTGSKSMLTAVGLVGAIISSNIWGFISDTKGRKLTIIATLLMAFVCSMVSSFSTSLLLYALFRFLNGFFIVASMATIIAYLGEFLSKTHRSRAIICACLFAVIAYMYMATLSKLILESTLTINIFGFKYTTWRIFTFLCTMPSLLAAISLSMFPESPKFLLCQGEQLKSLAVLRTMYKFNTNNAKDTFPVLNLLPDESANTNDNLDLIASIKQQIITLFKRPHRLYIAVVCFLQFGNYVISSGLFLWYSNILNQISKNGNNITITVCEAMIKSQEDSLTRIDKTCSPQVDDAVFRQNLIIGITYFFGYMAISAIINVIKKKYLIMSFKGLGCLSAILLYVITNPTAIDVLFIALMISPGVCGPMINAVVVDLFPTQLRAMAVSICIMVGIFGSVVSSSVTGFFLEINCNATLFTYAGILLLCSSLALIIPRKAKY